MHPSTLGEFAESHAPTTRAIWRFLLDDEVVRRGGGGGTLSITLEERITPMKKSVRKLALHRETLADLTLTRLAGGISVRPTCVILCGPSEVNTGCCPPTNPIQCA